MECCSCKIWKKEFSTCALDEMLFGRVTPESCQNGSVSFMKKGVISLVASAENIISIAERHDSWSKAANKLNCNKKKLDSEFVVGTTTDFHLETYSYNDECRTASLARCQGVPFQAIQNVVLRKKLLSKPIHSSEIQERKAKIRRNMSKTERRKLFQPIPLSSILDPTYQSPFSKLENFQVDMDITKINGRTPQTVWQKLQSSLLGAMSNFVIMSHPVFGSSATSAMSRSTHNMSLVPWNNWKPCDLIRNNERDQECQAVSRIKSAASVESLIPAEKTDSLFHSIRNGLQCLRYLATHPLSEEDTKRNTQTQTPTRHYYDCRKQNNTILLPAGGYSVVGGGGGVGLFFPQLSSADTSCRLSFSAPASPSHHHYYQASKPVVSNLFSWAMSGLFLTTPLHHPYMNALYNNYCIFSPVHATKGATVNTKMLCSEKSSENLDKSATSPPTSQAEGNIEIIFRARSSSISQESSAPTPKDNNMSSACSSSSASPTKAIPVKSSPVKACSSGMGSSGCIRIERIETNWTDEAKGTRNYHTVSVCSTSSSLKGGAMAFACASSMGSSPRNISSSARSAAARRFQTESESSADSFVEFSASVESTDSFCIVFESAPGCDEDVDYDEEWEDEDDDDEDESDEDDQVYNYSGNSDDIFGEDCIFQADGIDEGEGVATTSDEVDLGVDRKKKPKKKTVSFDEEHLEKIIEFEDDSESKSCRETYWEMFVRDRDRFKDRIRRTGDILEPILLPSHRMNVFKQRFSRVVEG